MLHHVAAGAGVALVVAAAAVSARAPSWPDAFAEPAAAPSCIGRSVFQIEKFHTGHNLAHASSAVALRDGRLRAVWYEGRRELSPDVRIWTAAFDGARWSAPRAIVDTAQATAGSGRCVRKIGNPLIFRDAGGALVLLFASLCIGGWDGVSLKAMRSRDEGESWSPPGNLTTAAIFNLGTNVRGPALVSADGRTLVPTSHEFWKSFPELVLLDRRGRVVGKRRIGVEFGGSQPFVQVQDRRRASAFMRVPRGFTLVSRTDDAGNTWSAPAPTSSANFGTPVAVTAIGDQLLMIHSAIDASGARWALAFSLSSDGGMTWRTIHSQPFGPGLRDVPKYPWLAVGADGLYHLLFTFAHARSSGDLMHARFSRDWIAERKGPPCPPIP